MARAYGFGAKLGGGMWHREGSWDDLLPRWALGDAGMWALVHLLLSLGGGFLIFMSIFAGEPESLTAGGSVIYNPAPDICS